MHRFARLAISVSLVAVAGCGQAHEPEDGGPGTPDAPGVDAFVPPGEDGGDPFPDGGPITEDGGPIGDDSGDHDAGMPPEACDAPGTIEDVDCGMCGTQTRFCTTALVWEYGACTDGPGAECLPGSSSSEACGMCGTQTLLCNVDCEWVPSGACGMETGACLPGATERDTSGCPGGGSRRRTCADDCAWGPYEMCSVPPTDVDGDGDPYTTDCNDADPSIGVGSTRTCGSFFCGTAGMPMTGTSTCVGPGWSVCARPAGCSEATCTPTAMETRTCAGECLPSDLQSRRCAAGGTWGAWGACSGPSPTMRPPACAMVGAEESCGVCDEGVAYPYCDGTCTVVTSECMGMGCTPGARTRTTTGCAAGEYRESTCSAACTPGPSMCMPYPPDVDVLILVDVTGSHTFLVMENADALATELAAPLLADADVRVGVATFADFPHGAFGSPGDVPFEGLLAPTADETMVEATLTTLSGMSGGDGPESGVQALYELAGGASHPDSEPFTCSAGLDAGGCWRPGSQRIVVIITDITQHNGPQPGDATMIHEPYSGFVPPAASWVAARDEMSAAGIGLFAIVPAGLAWGTYDTEAQLSIMTSELGQDPGEAVVTYPMGTMDITAAIRATAANIATYVGL